MTEDQWVTRMHVCFPVLASFILTQAPVNQFAKSSLVQTPVEYSSFGGIFYVKFTVPDHCCCLRSSASIRGWWEGLSSAKSQGRMHLYWTAARVKMLHPIPIWISQDSASAKLFISFFFLLPKKPCTNYSSNFFPVSWKIKFPRIQISPLSLFQ